MKEGLTAMMSALLDKHWTAWIETTRVFTEMKQNNGGYHVSYVLQVCLGGSLTPCRETTWRGVTSFNFPPSRTDHQLAAHLLTKQNALHHSKYSEEELRLMEEDARVSPTSESQPLINVSVAAPDESARADRTSRFEHASNRYNRFSSALIQIAGLMFFPASPASRQKTSMIHGVVCRIHQLSW